MMYEYIRIFSKSIRIKSGCIRTTFGLIRTVKPRGFTLLELMTVMGVFGILSVLIVAIHQQVSLLQRRTQGENKAVSEARFALETMATALRIGTVYYAGYARENAAWFDAGPCGIIAPAPGSTLYIIDEDKERIRYGFTPPSGSNRGYITKTFFGSKIAPVRPPSSARVTADDLNVTSFLVLIQPLCYPYDGDCVADGANIRQPLVTLTMGVEVPKQGGTRTEYVQTSISSRVYREIADVCERL